MGEELASAGLGQPHQVFEFEVVVEFRLLVDGKRAGFLPFDELPDALTRSLGRFEVNHRAGAEGGDELNELFVWFHNKRAIGMTGNCETYDRKDPLCSETVPT